MPLVCTKNRNEVYEAITTRILARKQTESRNSTETLKTFSVTSSKNSIKCLAGTSIPNSTIKFNTNNLNPHKNEPYHKNNQTETDEPGTEPCEGLSKIKELKVEDEKREHDFAANSVTSVNSMSQKLKELKELCTQLRKSSYEPKTAAFPPRRPTIEAIKSAIEKAKRMEIERNKSIGTDDKTLAAYMSDASTATEIKKARARKKKNANKTQIPIIDSSPTTTTEKKKKKTKPVKNKEKLVKCNANVEK